MSTRLSRLLLCSALLAASTALFADEARISFDSITVTSFNIKYFGKNGDPHSTDPEARIDSIRAHLTRERLWTDVIVFEEIVDVQLLRDDLLGDAYKCRSYDHDNPGHQHVVICYERQYTLAMASDEDDFLLEDVTLGEDRYRPAVHGIVKNASGQELLHVIGVHLKAYPDFSSTRLRQADVIANYVDMRADDVPVILLGDFNTYNDDVEQISALLDHAAEGLVQVPVPGDYTWRSGTRGNKLDHVWLSRGMRATNIRVAGPCNSNDRAVITTYNQDVSDHCPVTLTVARARGHQ